MIDSNPEHHVRFQDADWYDPNYEITVGGAGSIGSWLLLFLSRIGYSIFLYEMDRVEFSNIGGQLYGQKDVGKTKQEAIRQTISEFAIHEEIESMGRYEADNIVTPICFSCFDNMEARKLMFEKWVSEISNMDDTNIKVFVDGRLTAESFQMYIVTPDRIDGYRETLFDDDEVEDLPCSYKSTSHIAAMLASQMTTALTNAVVRFIHGDVRDLPFETRYEASMYLYEQKFEPEIKVNVE